MTKDIIDIAMQLTSQSGWRKLSLLDIANTADITLDQLTHQFPNKNAILHGLYDRLDQCLELANDLADETIRDQLFAIMMDRLDRAQPYREALIKMHHEGLPRTSLCRSRTWMKKMLTRIGASPKQLPKWLLELGIGVIWAMVIPTWFKDDSPDLSQTMAALDTQLGNAENLWLNLGKWCRRNPLDIAL